MLDVLLVRHGPAFGVLAATLFALALTAIARALGVRRRRAAALATLGAAEALDEAAIGRAVVLEGTLESDASVPSHATQEACLASSVRTADTGSEHVTSRGRGARLRVGKRALLLDGSLEVVVGREERVLRGRPREAAIAELGDRTGEIGELVGHAVRAGDRVSVSGRLEKVDGDYREASLSLVADGGSTLRLAATEPSSSRGRRTLVFVTVAAFVLPLGLLQVAALGALSGARAHESAIERGEALPLSGSHRLALLGLERTDALASVERLMRYTRPSDASLALGADALEARGRCAQAVELLGEHGLFEDARARAARCASPWVARSMAALERADGRFEEALSWAERARPLVSARDATARRAWEVFVAQLLVESGRYAEAAASLEETPPTEPTWGYHVFECVIGALRTTAGDHARIPPETNEPCALARSELGATTTSEWLTHGGRVAGLAALASPGAEPMGHWVNIDGVDPDAVLRGELPRWDGLAREALDGARRRDDPDVRGARCQLAEAEAMHVYRRSGIRTELPEGCRFESFAALVALESGEPVEAALIEGLPQLISAFRGEPTLERLRALVTATSHRQHMHYWDADEEDPEERERRLAALPPTPVERAAIDGDGRVLEHLFGARIAAYAASTHREPVLRRLRLAQRQLGLPWVSLSRLRERAYDDLWIARGLGDAQAVAAAEARVDRLSAPLEDRRQVVLLEILRAAAR